MKQNYIGLSVLYEDKGDYKQAFYYLKEFYLLKDSLNGLDVNLKIADLETKYEIQKKEASLKEARLKINESDRKMDRVYFFIFILISSIVFIVYRFRMKISNSKNELEINKNKLFEIRNLLIKKNDLLLKKEEELKLLFSEKESGEDFKSFDINTLRILTESDWISFKTYFDKLHPNYIRKLRKVFSKITDAEERLFLCLKLNMTTKEIASVIGISNESVKKSRNRLRKKLELNSSESLEVFVENF